MDLEQYDTERNYPFTPHDIVKSSDKKVYFKFSCGHSRPQRVADKTGKNSRKCPECLNRGGIGRSLWAEYPEYANMFMEEKKESLLVHMPELKNFMDDEDDRNGNPEEVCSASHT